MMQIEVVEPRGTGRTTNQMKTLPRGGLFITPYAYVIPYYSSLAAGFGRYDIAIYSVDQVLNHDAVRGMTFADVIIDHSIKLDQMELNKLRIIRLMCCGK